MTVTTTTWAALQNKKNQLIRKALEGSVFKADYSSAAITTLTSGASSALVALPAGWDDLGLLSTDGVQFSRSVDTSNVSSWGFAEPTRSDITKDTTTGKILCQETKLATIGLFLGVDVSAVLADATTGEVSIESPDIPPPLFYRLLTVSVDLGEGGEIYIARFLPRAQVTAFDDQKQGQGDDPIAYGVTFTPTVDSVLGYAQKHFWGGPGWMALLDDMGIDTA